MAIDYKHKIDLLKRMHKLKQEAQAEVKANRYMRSALQSDFSEAFKPITNEVRRKATDIEEKLDSIRSVSEDQLKAIEDQGALTESHLKALTFRNDDSLSSIDFQTPNTSRKRFVKVETDFDNVIISDSGNHFSELGLPTIYLKQKQLHSVKDTTE